MPEWHTIAGLLYICVYLRRNIYRIVIISSTGYEPRLTHLKNLTHAVKFLNLHYDIIYLETRR